MNTDNTGVTVKEQNTDVLNQNNLFGNAGMTSTGEKLPVRGNNLPEQSGSSGSNDGYGDGYYYDNRDGYQNNNGYRNNNGYDGFTDYYNDMAEYPTLTCKAANINFWNICFPGIFALCFLGIPTITALSIPDVGVGLFLIPFLLVGGTAAFITIFSLVKYLMVMKKGKRISGIVCGYEDDDVRINGRPAQIVRLLINTPVGKRYIMYKLGNTSQPYAIHSTVSLLAYKNYFKIMDNEEKIEW